MSTQIVNLALGGGSATHVVADQFWNPWTGEVFVNIMDSSIVDVAINGNALTFRPKAAGMTSVQAIGYDPNGAPVPGAQADIVVVVAPRISNLTFV